MSLYHVHSFSHNLFSKTSWALNSPFASLLKICENDELEALRNMKEKVLQAKLTHHFGDGNVKISSKDDVHFQVHVMSTEFIGKPLVKQHQMVYGVLSQLLQNEIHAVELKTYTPDKWR